jgi:transcriptional regulator with XRE-family HTH domain
MLFPNLKTFRELKNYTQKYMADGLCVTQNSYSLLENGKTEMDVNQLLRLAEILGVSPLMIAGRPVEVADIARYCRGISRREPSIEIHKLKTELEEKDKIIKELIDQLAENLK